MTIDLHVLGTASARPTSTRGVSGSVVHTEDGLVVVDAGEGFQTRFERHRKGLKTHDAPRRLKPNRIGALLFTHGHLDHTWGTLPWLQTMSLDHREQPLLVLGPTSSDVLDAMLEGHSLPEGTPPAELALQWKAWADVGGYAGFSYPVRWVLGDVENERWAEVNPHTLSATLLDAMPQPDGWRHHRLQALLTLHSVPSCGWMVERTASPGVFDRAKAKALGLTDQQRAQLARGEDVSHNGTLLESSAFRGPGAPPLRAVISGDTAERAPGFDPHLEPNLLVHEATFLDAQADKAAEHLHSTATGAVRTAVQTGAKALALTHYSSRIKSVAEPLDEALRETAHAGSMVPVVALQDGDVLSLNHEGVTHRVRHEEGWTAVSMAPNR